MEPRAYLEFRRRSDLTPRELMLWRHFAQDALLALTAATIWSLAPWGWRALLIAPLLMVLFFRSFSLMHEAVHRLAHESRAVNDLMGLVGGALCFLPFEPWRRSHLEHHHWSGNADRDPVMALVKVIPALDGRHLEGLNRLWTAWVPIVAFLQHLVFWRLAWSQVLREPRGLMLASVCLPVVLWSAIFLGTSLEFVMFALVPALVAYLALVEIVNLPHHLERAILRGHERLPAWAQGETARTCLYPRWFARLVVLNFNYHTEHHMFPDVPWYHLDRLHEELLRENSKSIAVDKAFAWIRRNRRRSLEDIVRLEEPQREPEPAEPSPGARRVEPEGVLR